ncbi:unnamed protein product [Caenorhabditis angaria]|uniref:Uncharacterized protein n=1 Tax=Caenorhabditis angaria TaxID=860376 RepID=A0A9P1IQG8_9PELO|nr:unnamed protein product [Caenorhabditis angaria]
MEKYQFSSKFVGETSTDWTYVSEYLFSILAICMAFLIVYLNYKDSGELSSKRYKNTKFVVWHLEEEIRKAREKKNLRRMDRKKGRRDATDNSHRKSRRSKEKA